MLQELIAKIEKYAKHDGECWRWIGAKQARGQTPAMSWQGKVGNVRRFILIEQGVPMKGYLATTSCGNADCVNQKHVTRTTRTKMSISSAAAMDAAKKALRAMRTADGLRNSSKKAMKLNMEQANAIREDDRPQRTIAADYGITQHTVYSIKRNMIWRDYQITAANPFAQLMR